MPTLQAPPNPLSQVIQSAADAYTQRQASIAAAAAADRATQAAQQESANAYNVQQSLLSQGRSSSSIPSWAIPVGIGIAVLGLGYLYVRSRKKSK